MSDKNRKAEEEDRKMLKTMIGWMQSQDSAADRERGRLNAEQRTSLMRERLARLGASPAAVAENVALTNLFYDHATTLHVESFGKTGTQPESSGSRQPAASSSDENNNDKADDEQPEASGSSATKQK
ncbi:hypothetical protein M3Y99_00401600 [Aphelenchoides fujianensis]|nr:hypothetical protein M3Y99_00401600 [Aphelenchoides fujianensis]